MGLDFNVEAIDPVRLEATGVLATRDLMSPYVWQLDGGRFAILVRAVPRAGSSDQDTGTIWYGEGSDGLSFTMDDTPVLVPGPGALDIGGCEDPTPVLIDGRWVVYYTGVDATHSSGQMLYAEGPDLRSLVKKGVALASSKTEGNTKEATIERTADGRWRLFYEYARDNASLIGLAIGNDVAGPWTEQPAPFGPRTDQWDSWHLSTGPMLTSDPDQPVMFYNGATQDARWRIGWVAFDRDCTKVVDRCIEPLIVPPPQLQRAAADIAFAASVVDLGETAHLYYSLADRTLERAVVRKFIEVPAG
jgi:predicted GH43/DUF377 family glycosyl hydrolase